MNKSNVMAYVSNSFTSFKSSHYVTNFCSVLLSVTIFSLWIALGYIDINFLFGDKSNAVEGETTLAACLSTHTPVGSQ